MKMPKEVTDAYKAEMLAKVLKALEPWFLQMLRYNNDEHHMIQARKVSAEKLIQLANEVDDA